MSRAENLGRAIAEVEREQRQRHRLYPRWIEAGRLLPETATQKQADLEIARQALIWLRANLDWIMEMAEARKAHALERDIDNEALGHPSVRAVRAAFPEAEVIGVRPMGARPS